MKEKAFRISLLLVAIAFTVIFCVVVVPPLIENPDILGALGDGFVNPYASGYAADVFSCWVVLLLWVIYEYPKVKYGWVCLILGFVPGVAVGFAVYLLLRTKQLTSSKSKAL